MGIPDRIFRISKAYLNQVRDRIDAELTERELASRELDRSLDPGSSSASRGSGGGVSSRPIDPEMRDLDISNTEDMMKRAEERIAAARRELESRTELNRSAERDASSSPSPRPASGAPRSSTSHPASSTTSGANNTPVAANSQAADNPNASDYRVLGVPVGSDLASVQDAYEKLARRCDPRRFPEGSAEQKDAARILERVNVSYEALRKRLDPTENRFGKLELE